MLLMLMALQAADPAPIDFDLAKVKPAGGACITGQANVSDILVCARKRNREIAVAVEPTVEPLLPKAEIGLFGGAKGRIEGVQGEVGGFTSNRVQATIAIPF